MFVAGGVRKSRLFIFVLVGIIASIFLLLFTFNEAFSRVPLDYAHKAQGYWQGAKDKHDPLPSCPAPPSADSSQIYNCQDPYRRPGYLHIDQADYKKTQWVPYTDDFLNAEAPDYAEYPVPKGKDIFFNVTDVDSEFLNSPSTPQQWMRMAVDEDKRRRGAVDIAANKQQPKHFVSMKDDGDLGWLWGRRMLFIGDSVDRFMIQFFCEEFGRDVQHPAKAHTTAHCDIPTLNLTLIQWHFAGGFTYRPDWWWMKDMDVISFEERWEKIWAPIFNSLVRGPTGQPDLVMWQNGLWDERALWEAGEAHYTEDQMLGKRDRQLVWQEIRFVAVRIKKFVQRLGEEFGPKVPVMFRSVAMHRDSNANDANLYELDRLSRAIAEKAGHETFDWGRIITAFSMLYKDNTHPGKGAASWLWGNMVLEYLARGVGVKDPKRSPYFDGWDACHPHLAGWGGR